METEKRIHSEELRNSDGTNKDFDFIIDKLSKKEQKIMNRQLERNYQRGFQQGMVTIQKLMEREEISVINRDRIEDLVEMAGEMRFNMKGRKYYSYLSFLHSFIEKVVKK